MTEIVIPGHEILNLIGEGGMAQVYAGARFGVGNSIKPVAVKVIRPELSSDPRFREMFLSEACAAMKFDHGNIVTVFDVGEIDDQLYMVMSWVDGVSLKQFAHALLKKRDQPLELSLVLSIAIQLLCALHYAHNYKLDRKKVGIVHRDVTPYNVMVSSSGEIKLLDFGVARIAGGRTTRSMKGNLVYMPREQALGNPRVESDIYAVGALIFELIEGERFRSHCKTEDDVLQDIHQGSVPELRRPDVPEEVRVLLREMLAVSWADRPHSAVEVIKRIEELPIKLLSSPIQIQELYERYFGEPHSGLTRFAHRDPELWVDHMRKLGKDRARGDAKKTRKVQSDAPQERSGDALPRTLLQPRAHAEVRLHPAMDEGSDPFEVQTTLRFEPSDVAKDEEPNPALGVAEALADEIMGDEGRAPSGAAPKPARTVRTPPASFAQGPNELAPASAMGMWVPRAVGDGAMQAPVRWRDLLAGPFGLLLLATFTFGVALPIACQATLPKAEVRR